MFRRDEQLFRMVLARYIRDKRAMALNREAYKDKILSHCIGAIVEYYKVCLAQRLGQKRWVQHWTTEVRTLEKLLYADLLKPIRGFKDRLKVAKEAIAYLKPLDHKFRTRAYNEIKRDYGLVDLGKVRLTDQDTLNFWDAIEGIIHDALD